MKTDVAIVGSGPAGLMLSQMLAAHGIASIILERRDRAHVLSRVRAGVLEAGTVDLLRRYGVGERLDAIGLPHDGVMMTWRGQPSVMIDGPRYAGRGMMVYGQRQITEDLFAARDAGNQVMIENADDVTLHDLESEHPSVSFVVNGRAQTIEVDFIAGCDGFHGPSRQAIPSSVRQEYERVYPFGWLGILAETPPVKDVTYAASPRGFALASHRSSAISRNYIQVPNSDRIEDWSDARFWDEFLARMPEAEASQTRPAPSLEKSIAPLRSFVSEPMRFGRLFLAGDSAHIVPPTGAKGLNLAFSDVFYISRALDAWYAHGNADLLDTYSSTALKRVWGAVRLSWWLTTLLHVFPDDSAFDRKIRESEYLHLASNEAAMRDLAEQFVGLPY
jgi:p-hydroxybenzoate 3-monooxygenase